MKKQEEVFRDSPLPDNPKAVGELIIKFAERLFHLRRSNHEIKQFDPELQDVDFKEAIEENIKVIEKYESHKDLLQDVHKEMTGKLFGLECYLSNFTIYCIFWFRNPLPICSYCRDSVGERCRK